MGDGVQPYLDRGEVEAVLEEFCPPFSGYCLYHPQRRQASPALRTLIDYLLEIRLARCARSFGPIARGCKRFAREAHPTMHLGAQGGHQPPHTLPTQNLDYLCRHRYHGPVTTRVDSRAADLLTTTVGSMEPESTIGDQELALVRHIADRGSASVAEAVDEFGTSRGLARSTVLTMMERLRKKGYLSRQMADGVFRYRACASSADLLKNAVQRFVERSLDGSVSPFLAYLSEAPELSDRERQDLERIVARLDAAQRKDG
jgi:predicted transcriptional regulator